MKELWAPVHAQEDKQGVPRVGADEAGAEVPELRPKGGVLLALADAAEKPAEAVLAKLKPVKAPAAGVLTADAGAGAAALAAPEPKLNPDGAAEAGAPASSTNNHHQHIFTLHLENHFCAIPVYRLSRSILLQKFPICSSCIL